MPDKPNQNFENHTKLVPYFHLVLLPILAINLFYRLYAAYVAVVVRGNGRVEAAMNLLLAFAFILTAFAARVFALQAQDRVIRLEEHARWQKLLNADVYKRIGEVRRPQLIALRFAPDEEVPGLIARVLTGELKEGKEIKQAIKNWRGDYHRL